MVAAVAPTERLGFWNGLNSGLTNAVVGICQITFSRVYDSFNNGSTEGKRGMQMLFATAGISFLSVLAYGALIPQWPNEVSEKAKKKKDDDYSDLDKWEKLSDMEWARLPMETVDNVSMKMIENGKVPRIVVWGDYSKEFSELSDLRRRAPKDFTYFATEVRDCLTDRNKMIGLQKMEVQFDEITPQVRAAPAV